MRSRYLERPSPFGRTVGRRIVALDVERGTIEVEYLAHDGFTNRIGTLAGAILAGLLDSVTGLVANAVLTDDFVAVTKSLSVEYRRPGKPGRLIGRGRIVDRTEREIHSAGELLDADGDQLATADATLRIIPWPETGT